MERSEPSLVPEWLRSTGGGTGGGSSSHHFASSQADGPLLALPKRNRPSKSNGSSDASHSSFLDRSSSSNSRRSSSSNGSTKHDKNSYSRSYSSFTRSQRDRERDKLNIADNWELEYADPLRSMITARTDDSLRRSQSMISRRQGDVPQRRSTSVLRNGVHNNHDNGNGTHSLSTGNAGSPKVSFERDFPMLGSDERPKTPDIIRVSSPGLSRGIQGLSIGNSPLVVNESWNSALAEAPTVAGNNGIGSSHALQTPAAFVSGSNSPSSSGNILTGLNMAEALVQAPTRPQNVPQQSVQTQRDELAIAQSKKLIPVTALPKPLVPNPSDKLKPKTAMRSSEAAVAPKNGVQQLTPLQLGSQYVRGASIRVDGPKSPSSGKLLVLKPGRENGVSPVLKDIQSPTANVNNRVGNGHSTGPPSAASAPHKNPNNQKISGERKASAYGLNSGPVVDKRTFLAQAQSRNDFFNMMRKKSMTNSSAATGSETAVSSDIVEQSDKEVKELPREQVTQMESDSELRCNGETCTVEESSDHSKDNDNAAMSAEEEAFLRSLGWERDADAADEGGLTQEEINKFYEDVRKKREIFRLCRGRLPRILSHFELHAGGGSTEPSASTSQTEA